MASRRQFLQHLAQLSSLLVTPSLLAACGSAAPSPAQPAAAPAAAPAAPAPGAPAAPAAAPAQPSPAVAAAPAAPAGKFVFIWGSSEFPVRLNPQYSTSVPSTQFYDNFYDTLTRRDPDLKLL